MQQISGCKSLHHEQFFGINGLFPQPDDLLSDLVQRASGLFLADFGRDIEVPAIPHGINMRVDIVCQSEFLPDLGHQTRTEVATQQQIDSMHRVIVGMGSVEQETTDPDSVLKGIPFSNVENPLLDGSRRGKDGFGMPFPQMPDQLIVNRLDHGVIIMAADDQQGISPHKMILPERQDIFPLQYRIGLGKGIPPIGMVRSEDESCHFTVGDDFIFRQILRKPLLVVPDKELEFLFRKTGFQDEGAQYREQITKKSGQTMQRQSGVIHTVGRADGATIKIGEVGDGGAIETDGAFPDQPAGSACGKWLVFMQSTHLKENFQFDQFLTGPGNTIKWNPVGKPPDFRCRHHQISDFPEGRGMAAVDHSVKITGRWALRGRINREMRYLCARALRKIHPP